MNEAGVEYYGFPQPEALAGLGEDDLKACNLGYRSKYVVRAARSVASGETDLDAVRQMPYQQAKEALLKLFGVGDKVADCICLFALHHLQAFPVDTHIRQALEAHYRRGFPHRRYQGVQGVIQQYIFYYELCGKTGKPDVQEEQNMLKAGMKAPDFTLMDKDGRQVSLSDFAGKKVVLYFYPKDNTPGCTRQACAFAGAYRQFEALGVQVIGISKDSIKSHQNFAAKYELPFLLLSDPELQAIQAYDVWKEKKLYGKVSMGVLRSTYIIDENGMIEKAMEKVKPDTNAAEILEYLSGEEAK